MRQAGYFTAAQAVELGYSYQAQKHHVDHGNWTRVDRGLFRLPDWPTRPDDTYVLWRLWSRDRATVSHESALVVHDLGEVNPPRTHLTVPPGFRARHPAVRLHFAVLPVEDIEDREGYRVTTAERTLLDAAAGETTQEQLDAAVSDALTQGLLSPLRACRQTFARLLADLVRVVWRSVGLCAVSPIAAGVARRWLDVPAA